MRPAPHRAHNKNMADHGELQLGINVNDVQVSATENWSPLGDNFVVRYYC